MDKFYIEFSDLFVTVSAEVLKKSDIFYLFDFAATLSLSLFSGLSFY